MDLLPARKTNFMKRVTAILTILLFAAVTAVSAQTDTPQPDTISDPVQEGDPTFRHIPPQADDYVKDMNKITPEELPAPVRKTLDSNARYEGWQKGQVFVNKTNDHYVIQIKESDKTMTYRFDKDGKQVLDE
jgi:hypothetical protein